MSDAFPGDAASVYTVNIGVSFTLERNPLALPDPLKGRLHSHVGTRIDGVVMRVESPAGRPAPSTRRRYA
jgi:hypothetical protein